MPRREQHNTSVSLHPLSFDEAIEALAKAPKRAESEAEARDSSRASAPESETSEPRTSPRQTSSDD